MPCDSLVTLAFWCVVEDLGKTRNWGGVAGVGLVYRCGSCKLANFEPKR